MKDDLVLKNGKKYWGRVYDWGGNYVMDDVRKRRDEEIWN